MLVSLDGTSSKSSTFGVKRPKVHHTKRPVGDWVDQLANNVLFGWVIIDAACLISYMEPCGRETIIL